MVGAVHEVAVYVHRFHNLDLFEQGQYQLKISMRWEDSACNSSPSRVVQYEVSELDCDDVLGAWRIDDTDNSFLSQPFRIRYAKQDIFLCVMITFSLPVAKYKGPNTSAVILKFELLFESVFEKRSNLESSWDAGPAAIHEFRIPPKALLGLHSYCPVYFDVFHSVLVDTSVHISLLKGGSIKTPSNTHGLEETDDDKANNVVFVKALSTCHAILLKELRNLSNTISQTIYLTAIISNHNDTKLLETVNVGSSQVADKMQNDSEETVGTINDDYLHSLQKDEISGLLQSLGDQILNLWKTYLKFHRDNKTRIMEQLHDVWANDRRAEWSIWIISSKVEMLHQNNCVLGPVHAFQKITQHPAETAATRAELHRGSIAHMKMNNRSIQDLQIFGDPLRTPIVIVERVVIAPFISTFGNSYLEIMDMKDAHGVLSNFGSQRKGSDLKIVVFVHGFLGHHLDLRLVRNQWLLLDPETEILMSKANEDKTAGDFREMGSRLAQEVVSFIKKRISKCNSMPNVKLSFVGHSIGNIIIRTALAESIMEPYHKFLYTCVSLSGPHLGYLYSSNSLFNSGVWLLKRLKNTPCIHQLTFTDDIELTNTFLYQLCQQKTLDSFKNIILVSSPQDGYVPYHSARMEMCQASSQDNSRTGQVFLEMLNNCLEQIRAPSSEQRMFMRCDVNFDVSLQGRNLNTIIGRAAHIEFLETNIFVKFIMWSFPEFFS